MPPGHSAPEQPGSSQVPSTVFATARHSIREQDALWAEFLSYSASVVEAMRKSVQAVCEARFDLVPELEVDEEDSDRREVLIEQQCLLILARYEPVASDLRRMATVLKVNHDWERIADLALRVARRARKLARRPGSPGIPEELKQLARDVLAQIQSCHDALAQQDSQAARAVIAGDDRIDALYRQLRRSLKASLAQQPEQLNSYLALMGVARNLERVADHAGTIAQTVVYLKEGTIIRHAKEGRSSDT